MATEAEQIAELRELLREAIEVQGNCHQCLDYSCTEEWWERVNALDLWDERLVADGA